MTRANGGVADLDSRLRGNDVLMPTAYAEGIENAIQSL